MWTTFKVLLEFVTILLLLFDVAFLAMWDLAFLVRDESPLPALEGKYLTTGPPSKPQYWV